MPEFHATLSNETKIKINEKETIITKEISVFPTSGLQNEDYNNLSRIIIYNN